MTENGILSEHQGTFIKFHCYRMNNEICIFFFSQLCLKSYRVEQEGSLVVDSGIVATGSSPGLLNQLNINNGLYLGELFFSN